jgi:lipoprotein signal peptidase
MIALGLLVAVVLLDQGAKWWGWRHVSGAIVNSGSTWLIGAPVSGWFSSPVTGPLLDVLDVGLLSLAGHVLVRRRRPGLVLVSGALMTAGWGSNLLDRLGLHAFTAPGSVRGAIDFIHLGRPYLNLADFVIVGATVVFPLAVWAPVRTKVRGSATSRSVAPALHQGIPLFRQVWPAAVGLAVALVLSMTTAIGVESPPVASVDGGSGGWAARGRAAPDLRPQRAVRGASSADLGTPPW